jgi:hypothetical protein
LKKINKFLKYILARRALDQSNGAMFLNRKLIVQLSTSRFRPQPKEINTSISQPTKQPLMIMSAPSSSSPIPYHHPTGGLKQQQQQSTPLTYYNMMTSTKSLPDNPNIFHPPSPLSQDINNYYSQYSNVSIDRMTPTSLKMNHMRINKNIKSGNFNRMDLIKDKNGSIPGMSNLLDTFAKK